MAIFTTIPVNAKSPSTNIKPKLTPTIPRVGFTPIIASGIVSKIRPAILNELNYSISAEDNKIAPMGKVFNNASLELELSSASPPNSNVI